MVVIAGIEPEGISISSCSAISSVIKVISFKNIINNIDLTVWDRILLLALHENIYSFRINWSRQNLFYLFPCEKFGRNDLLRRVNRSKRKFDLPLAWTTCRLAALSPETVAAFPDAAVYIMTNIKISIHVHVRISKQKILMVLAVKPHTCIPFINIRVWCMHVTFKVILS